jgi:hypothetical protein
MLIGQVGEQRESQTVIAWSASFGVLLGRLAPLRLLAFIEGIPGLI